MPAKLGTELHRKALETDQAWSIELQRLFGKRAGDVRYTKQGKGEPGTALHAIWQAREAADIAWNADQTLSPSTIDVGTVTEYGLTQKLSCAIRCF
jgi:hypothetical protein